MRIHAEAVEKQLLRRKEALSAPFAHLLKARSPLLSKGSSPSFPDLKRNPDSTPRNAYNSFKIHITSKYILEGLF